MSSPSHPALSPARPSASSPASASNGAPPPGTSASTSPLAMLGKRQPSADRGPRAVFGFGAGGTGAVGSPPRNGGAAYGDEGAGGRARTRGRQEGGRGTYDEEMGHDGEKQQAQAEGKGGKAKDLSHVPCRFFQKGRCEQGEHCQFSHDRGEPGQQKKVCEYFLKGSCRFGHKCALAHLLPGEPISMDRKHKKDAQRGVNVAGPASGISKQAQAAGQQSLGAGDMATSPPGSGKVPRAPSYSQTLQAGGSKPKRAGAEPAREMPIHGVLREGLAGQSQTGSFPELARSISPNSRHRMNQAQIQANRAGAGGDQLAVGSPSRSSALSRVISARGPGDDADAFQTRPLSVPGPLGGSGRAVSFGFERPGGQSPSGSQTAIGGDRPSSSPFTAPGSNGLFPSHQDGNAVAASWHPRRPLDLKEASLAKPVPRPLSTSVGGEFTASRDIWGERTSSYTGSPSNGGFLSPARRPLDLLRKTSDTYALDDDDEDDNGEEFLPSSLNELLTPRERARRLSRRDSNHSSGAVGPAMGWPATAGQQARPITSASSSFDGRTNMELLLSRQAHSASAVVGGFLQNLWDDSGEDARKSKISTPTTIISGGHATADGPGGATAVPGDTGFALGPSNNSMGFLPQFGTRVKLGAPSSLLTDQHKALNQPRPSGLASHFPARPSPLTQPSTIDMFAEPTFDDDPQTRPARVISTMSPNAKALQNHAPGQSLPQGLAAGLSRLHLQPVKQHEGITLAQSPAGSAGGGFSPGLEPFRSESERRTTGLSNTKTRDEIEDDDLFEMER